LVVLNVRTASKMPPRDGEYDRSTDIRLKHHAAVHIIGWRMQTYDYRLDISTRRVSMLEPTPPAAFM